MPYENKKALKTSEMKIDNFGMMKPIKNQVKYTNLIFTSRFRRFASFDGQERENLANPVITK